MRLQYLPAFCLLSTLTFGQDPAPQQPAAPETPKAPPDPIATMVGHLDLEKYKATIKGLTQFGDRRQGTERNRQAIDWIEAQLKSYGCTNTERITYDYQPPAGRGGAGRGAAGGAAGAAGAAGGGRGRGNADPNIGPGGARRRGNRQPESVNNDPLK